MAGNYDRVDERWCFRGDYLRGKDGDIADSSGDQILSFVDMIMDIVAADLNDWQEHPGRAASLSEFIGEPNTRETGKEIQDRVAASLTVNQVVRAQDLQVRVAPVDIYSVLIIITISALATPQNSLIAGDPLVITLAHDYRERGVMAVGYTGSRGAFPE